MATYLKPLYTRTLKPNKRAKSTVKKMVKRAMPSKKSTLTPLKKKAKPDGKQWKRPVTVPGRRSNGIGVGI